MTTPFPPTFPTLGIPSDEVIDALISGIVKITRRVEIYNADGVTPFDIVAWDARLVEGSISVDRERDERRIAEFSLENSDNLLELNPLGGFYYDKVLKAYWGIEYWFNGERRTWETPVGEFLIDRITEDNFPNVVKISCRDFTKKCLVSKLAQSVAFPIGTPIETIIGALAANAGVTKFALPYTGMSYSRDISFARGTPRWEVMKEIAASVSLEVFFRRDGYLTLGDLPDPSNTPISWSFKSGVDGSLVGYNRTANDSRIFNHVIVVGTANESEGIASTVFGEAINDDLGSPTSRVNLLQDRVDSVESDLFMSNADAQNYAEARLRIGSLETYEVSFDGLIIPWLEAGDIIDVHDGTELTSTARRFLLSNYNLPMKLGPMSGLGRRVLITGTNEELGYQ